MVATVEIRTGTRARSPRVGRILRETIFEEIITYRTLSCSKAKPYWKPYWDFPLKQGQKKDVKCIYQEGMSILELCSPLASTGNPNWVSNKVFSFRAALSPIGEYLFKFRAPPRRVDAAPSLQVLKKYSAIGPLAALKLNLIGNLIGIFH